MRLLRLELENVRGVKSRSLNFSPDGSTTGVVVVEGRNEAGKSTLGDALDALLNYKDSSTRAEVRSLQTTGEDEPPVVEAELQIGDYRFVYRKSFLKRSSTTLEILEPRPEPLNSDAAHERVEQMLDEGIDRTLWSSLRLRQGEVIHQAGLGTAAGLANVMVGSGDAGVIGERELSILEEVRDEFLRYFTKGGREGKRLRDAQTLVSELEARHAELEDRRAELEDDVERADRLNRSLPTLREHVAEADENLSELKAAFERVEALSSRVEECERNDELARGKLDSLTGQRDLRTKLVGELARLQTDQEELNEQQGVAQKAADTAAKQLEDAVSKLEGVKTQRTEAGERREQAQRDVDLLQASTQLEDLRARADRAAEAGGLNRTAEATVAGITVDDALLDEIKDAQTHLLRAEAALDAASPELAFSASERVTIAVGGELEDLEAGDRREWTVRGRLTLRVGDIGEVVVSAGGGSEDAVDNQRTALERLQDTLRRGGVQDLSAAERAHRQRRDAEREAAEARREQAALLGDRTMDELTHEVERLESLVTNATESRQSDHPLPADTTVARTVLDDATEAERAAIEALSAPESAVERIRDERDARRQEAVEARVHVEETTTQLHAVTEELTAARERISDDDLAEQLRQADSACAALRVELDEAREELQVADPDTVRARKENAEELAKDARNTLETTRQDLRDTRVRIEVKGGEGLHERCQDAEAELLHAQTRLEALQRRARAAKLLKERREDHHDRARERYAAPLKHQLLTYGKMLYGPDFDVEFDDNLRVARRRHQNLWLDVDQLSVGAREQLALLGRLACATLLGDTGGLLLFDDALGNTDPDRLERIGAVLRVAGDHSQIVVLTCYPDRYRHIGGATRIAL